MSVLAKEYATEIDCKIRQLRKKTATFAYDCIAEDSTKVEPAKQFLAAEQNELTRIELQCSQLAESSEQLDKLLQEADETASKIYARLCEMFADLGMDTPTFDDDEIPIGIPIERLVPRKGAPEELSEALEELSMSQCSTEVDGTEAEFKPNIVIGRPSDSGGPPTWTPMIKVKMNKVSNRLPVE